MTSKDLPPSPSLRDEQVELTRNRILEAVADLIAADGVFDFTVQQVADKAGVSHRTIYRHFPDRTALLNGLSAGLSAAQAEHYGVPSMASEEFDPIEGIDTTWQLFEMEHQLMEALVIASVGAGVSLPARRQRTEDLKVNLADALAHLEPELAHAVMAVVRSITSSLTWFELRRDHDVDMDRARQAIRWAMRVLLGDLRAGGGPTSDDDTTT